MKSKNDLITSAFLGAAIGDALGVPVEFSERKELSANPVKSMLGKMMHNQLPGTWSDDSSMIFCTAESLCNGYSLDDIALLFSSWKNNKFWTPRGRVFDIGIATNKGIERIDRFLEMGIHVKPIPSKETNEHENGNGSLMRMLPLIFFLKELPFEERFKIVKDVSALTHAHDRSVVGCIIYIEFGIQLIAGYDKFTAYRSIQESIREKLHCKVKPSEIDYYTRILDATIWEEPESAIQSTAYVLHSLEAALWSLLKNNTYAETVLEAVNLGGDTDTIASIAGGLAGMIYGIENIPSEWIEALARKEDILDLAVRFSNSIS